MSSPDCIDFFIKPQFHNETREADFVIMPRSGATRRPGLVSASLSSWSVGHRSLIRDLERDKLSFPDAPQFTDLRDIYRQLATEMRGILGEKNPSD